MYDDELLKLEGKIAKKKSTKSHFLTHYQLRFQSYNRLKEIPSNRFLTFLLSHCEPTKFEGVCKGLYRFKGEVRKHKNVFHSKMFVIL